MQGLGKCPTMTLYSQSLPVEGTEKVPFSTSLLLGEKYGSQRKLILNSFLFPRTTQINVFLDNEEA